MEESTKAIYEDRIKSFSKALATSVVALDTIVEEYKKLFRTIQANDERIKRKLKEEPQNERKKAKKSHHDDGEEEEEEVEPTPPFEWTAITDATLNSVETVLSLHKDPFALSEKKERGEEDEEEYSNSSISSSSPPTSSDNYSSSYSDYSSESEEEVCQIENELIEITGDKEEEEEVEGKDGKKKKKKKKKKKRDLSLMLLGIQANGPFIDFQSMSDNRLLELLETACQRVFKRVTTSLSSPSFEDSTENYGGWKELSSFKFLSGYISIRCMACCKDPKDCTCVNCRGNPRRPRKKYFSPNQKIEEAFIALKTPPSSDKPMSPEEIAELKKQQWETFQESLKEYTNRAEFTPFIIDHIMFVTYAKNRWRGNNGHMKPRCPVCGMKPVSTTTYFTQCKECSNTDFLKKMKQNLSQVAEPLVHKIRLLKRNKRNNVL